MIYKVEVQEVETNKPVRYPLKLLIQCHPKVLEKEVKKEVGLRSVIIADKWQPVEVYHVKYTTYPLFDIVQVVLAYQEVENLTKSELADKIGITRPTLDALLKKQIYSRKTEKKIEEELGVSLNGDY